MVRVLRWEAPDSDAAAYVGIVGSFAIYEVSIAYSTNPYT